MMCYFTSKDPFRNKKLSGCLSIKLCYADTPRRWRIRIRYVSDTDTPRIRLGYVSSRILKKRIRICLGTRIRYFWARWDTTQSSNQPTQMLFW